MTTVDDSSRSHEFPNAERTIAGGSPSAGQAMKGLTARVDTPWIAFTPLAAHTLTTARNVAFGADGPYAAAVVGVYGSGKSTLLFAVLREALAHGLLPVWDEAAAFLERMLPGNDQVLPQEFVARVRDWLDRLGGDTEERARYLTALERRGREDVAAVLRLGAKPASQGVVLLLDEVEQAHQILLKRIATDDGQPLRALIDACGPKLRLLLAYAPESYHALGDADRGRLVTLPVPSIDVGAIQALFGLGRGHANFAWWISRGRARGVEQAVRGVIEPLRAGLFDADLTALGDAVDALPGVFGVPALLREGLDHGRLRALARLQPEPSASGTGGVVIRLGDRRALADRIRHELTRRLGTKVDLEPVANEVVSVLEATAGDDDCAYLTLDDFGAALRVAEARAVESGRMREPLERLVQEGARIFDALGEMGPLERRLPFALRELCDERFPSPFTDPFLPLEDGRVPTEVELDRRFRELTAAHGPLLVSEAGGFSVFANAERLARHIESGALDTAAEPLRALLLDTTLGLPPLVELAGFAGRLTTLDPGRFHATFLKCLALRARASSFGTQMDALIDDHRADRQLARKIAWHRDRVAVQVRDVRPRPDATWQAAAAYIRQNETFRGTLARLDRESPALLGLLFALRPLGVAERAVCIKAAALLAEGSPLRRLAREANPGGRLSGAAVVIDGPLPAGARAPRWTEQLSPGARELAQLLDRFAGQPSLRQRLATWLYPEDRARLETLIQYHGGALPDLTRELDALEALRRLDDTSRRAAAIVADLERCTGRRQASLTALKLGTFTDQVRLQAGPVEQLRSLAAELEDLQDQGVQVWVRALMLWICGVIAARLLKGIEKEQAALADWERIGTLGADLGRQADELQRALAGAGAQRCVELLRHRRAQLANSLDSAVTAARGVENLRVVVVALGPLVAGLEEACEALRERGISVDEALESYLPDLDESSTHLSLLRRVPEWLAELGQELPRPAGRGLVDYLEALRRHAETTRRNRLRMRLEDLLGATFDPELRVNADEVDAIDKAWQTLAEPTRDTLRSGIQGAAVRGSDEIQRWIVDCASKAEILAGWADPGHRLLSEVDERVARWSLTLSVAPDELREAARKRTRAIGALQNLRSGLLAAEVMDELLGAGLAAEGGRAYQVLVQSIREFEERLNALRERYAKIAGNYPGGALEATTRAAALEALESMCAAKQSELEAEVTRVRELSALLAEHGDRGAAIPAELSLLGAARLVERETARVRDALTRKHEALTAWMASAHLPAELVPAPAAELAQWRDELLTARRQATEVHALLETSRRLGLPADGGLAGDWPSIAAQIQARNQAAQEELQTLQRRADELAERCARLGGPRPANLDPAITLEGARKRVERAESEVVRMRQERLASASEPAREVYSAILAGGGAELPPAVAELVALGLLRTMEDAR